MDPQGPGRRGVDETAINLASIDDPLTLSALSAAHSPDGGMVYETTGLHFHQPLCGEELQQQGHCIFNHSPSAQTTSILWTTRPNQNHPLLGFTYYSTVQYTHLINFSNVLIHCVVAG